MHYAPPGAQILHTNPLFVRSHDFLGVQGSEPDLAKRRKSSAPAGRPAPAAAWSARWPSLPYALAEAEQNFLIPTREQALIWGDLVPQMILSAEDSRAGGT